MLEQLQKQKAYFESGQLRNIAVRKELLNRLNQMIRLHEKEWTEALKADLGKPAPEAFMSEIAFMYQEIRHTLGHLDRWARPQKVNTPFTLWPGSSRVLPEGRGVNLIISPWNYPMMLLLAPLVSCLAAGNTAVLLPSDQAPATSTLAEQLVGRYFKPEEVWVAAGPGAEVFKGLTEQFRFDFIFFTGSIAVGKIIAAQAAKTLTPVVLELGGKSPCLVLNDAHISLTAKRIAWGKYYNAGQTCVSPDYVMVTHQLKDQLIAEIRAQLEKLYGVDPKMSPDYGRIVNHKQLHRLLSYLDQGKVHFGGQYDESEKYLAPTLMEPYDLNGTVMNEEIFGPVLPVIGVSGELEMLDIISKRPNPLSCYVFSKSKKSAFSLMQRIPFGGGIVNHHLLHLANPDMPFGGIAASGLGRYHGKYGFEGFSHLKSVMHYPATWDVPLMYPPYTDIKNKLLRWILS